MTFPLLHPDAFAGKVAFVSGAASGIGASTARMLADLGVRLILADRDGERLAAFAATLSRHDALALEVDVASNASVETAIARGVGHFGRLDFAVNSAGIDLPRCETAQYPAEQWDRIIAVNLTGVFHAVRYQIPKMLACGGGSIVNIASIMGLRAFPGQPAYTAAKHGVIGLTKAAALDHAAHGIRINAVAPGFVETPLLGHLSNEKKKAAASLHPMGRVGRADEITSVILFLLSDAASFVTGACYEADGGYLTK
ncbi:SDR family NAD(P)-dependent oxidoreductase [Mesorhizobium sp. BAC0120]|uniref:SDR family NAD(P)-dependent oxidoreductase n=1 Tax=Mesorhizobium sp. BAC0120 TaxID=3090670 RepID=UPI00298BF35D|nr:SDR family NAD(P)-dependent oxidoreductase [Mesorhizobium sp. BAC0120]MDW6021834.1 SDR family NAD(P)-dependent oxidoreductase [Mesorhizobium sp. BAC0120]